jgi:CheY-like chemotaxis protein
MNKTVLVIEDNEQNLYLVRFMLEKRGFTVHEARDGRLGITMASELPAVLSGNQLRYSSTSREMIS